MSSADGSEARMDNGSSGRQSKSSGEQDANLGLHRNSVSFWGDLVASVTDVAPSLSMALTLGSLATVMGYATPFIILVDGVIMLLIAIAFARLNAWKPSASAQVQWIGRALAPIVGFTIGVAFILASVISTVGGLTLVGPYFFTIFSPGRAATASWSFIASVAVVLIVVVIAIIGIKTAIRFQTIIVIAEYLIVLGFACAALAVAFAGSHTGSALPRWDWFSPDKVPIGGSLVSGLVIGVFLFAGWETPVYLGDEQKDAARDPGRSAIVSVVFCTVWYLFLAICFQSLSDPSQLSSHSADVLSFSASILTARPWSIFMSIAVLASIVAATQAVLNNGSRVMYGMARLGVLPERLGQVNRRFQTPELALVLLAVPALVVLGIYTFSTSAANALLDVISTGGLLYLAIYVIVAVAAVVYYRRQITRNFSSFLLAGLLPTVGVVALTYIFVEDARTTKLAVLIPTAFILLIGAAVAICIPKLRRVNYFQTPRETADRVSVSPTRHDESG